jgi:hypothetical protein
VVLAKEYVPKVRYWYELLVLLGLKPALPNVRYKYQISDLNIETVTEPRATASGYSFFLTEDYRRR